MIYLRDHSNQYIDYQQPSNLLINSKGEVKVRVVMCCCDHFITHFIQVTDFGVSAELQTSIAMCGTFVGTFK